MNNTLPPLEPSTFVQGAGVFLEAILERANKQGVIIALSGGIDSTTTLAIVGKTLPPKHIHVLQMPYQNLSDQGMQRGQSFLGKINIPQDNVLTIDIKPMVDSFASLEIDKIRHGNIMARIRMTILYDVAKKLNVLVVGTENRSEYQLGYFTRHGDEASDIELLRSLYKTQVYELANYLNVPQEVLNSTPSAELWAGQTDENELGFSYELADPILYLLCDKGYSAEQVVEQGFDHEDVLKIKAKVDSMSFKHHVPHIYNP